jgi:DNA transposition AAA+ family ATPase
LTYTELKQLVFNKKGSEVEVHSPSQPLLKESLMTLQQQLQKHMQVTGISATKIASDIGYSSALISQWLRGLYKGNIEGIDNAVKSYLSLQNEKSSLKSVEIPFCQVTNAKIVFGMLRRAQIDHKIVLITSESGYGKTESLKEYARRNSGAILIETDSTFTSKILISYLHKTLGYGGHGTKHSMFQEIILSLTGSNRVIIIDEADRLTYDSLELLRRLHDKTGIGIALAGAPVLVENIRGSRGEFAQLYTRIGGHAQLKPITEHDAELMIKAHLPEANGICKNYYSFCQKNGRTLYMLVYNTIRVSQDNNVEITPALIEKCAGMLAI